ncbi:MAG: hypothetical protein IJS44_03250 [Clostridia bacterium]|nr:hypothetical protein [Clostridia bacterium]
MQKKILSLVLTFCMLLSMFPFVMGASADENVIEVSNADELLAVMREIDSGGKINADEAVSGWGASDTIRLTADIDMTSTLASGHRYVIGSEDQKFAGIFDGNGHTITIDTSVRGLFGNVGGGTVKDLTVAGAATGATPSAVSSAF